MKILADDVGCMLLMLMMMRVRRMLDGIYTMDDWKVRYVTMGCYSITTWFPRLGFNFNIRVLIPWGSSRPLLPSLADRENANVVAIFLIDVQHPNMI